MSQNLNRGTRLTLNVVRSIILVLRSKEFMYLRTQEFSSHIPLSCPNYNFSRHLIFCCIVLASYLFGFYISFLYFRLLNIYSICLSLSTTPIITPKLCVNFILILCFLDTFSRYWQIVYTLSISFSWNTASTACDT